MNWHSISVKESLKKLNVNFEKGLSQKDIQERKKKLGSNKLPKEKALPGFKIFLEQFKSPLIYILVVAGIVTIFFPAEEEKEFLKKYADSIVIFAVVFLNTIVGFIQENKASKSLAALKKIVHHEAEVLRNGKLKIINSLDLMPGDIIFLNPGDRVPADARIIESRDLKINEMALTGEWLPAEKKSGVIDEKTALADRDNMVYMGTIVENGKGKAVVVEIGLGSEIGKIAEMVKETKEEETPYQKKLAKFSKVIGLVIGLICIMIFIEGVLFGRDAIEIFKTAIAVAVAAIPEGLPIAMTIILALGMQKILKRKGLVRKLVSAETLGSTSVIATDKTATLTEGKMKVSSVLTMSEIINGNKDKEKEKLSLKSAVLCSEAFVENPEASSGDWILRGRPTDKALLMAAMESKIIVDNIKKKEQVVGDLPFDPKNKYSASLNKNSKGEYVLHFLGAPDKVLSFCNLEPKNKSILEKKLESMAQEGLRVVATAYKKIVVTKSQIPNIEEEINNLNFISFIGIKDPVRKEVKEAIATCRRAGLRLVIITGDHKLTAKAVAQELDFKIQDKNILDGSQLDELSDKEFLARIKEIKIYARVEPKHKLRIVEAWKNKGEVVAMTGDGINDTPALKKADVGIAVGSGTEMAKETSDLILLNDSFSIIVAAIEEGRVILDNIRKVVTYLLSDSFTEVVLISVSIVLGFPLPVLAVQILWVNLIEDGPLGICLAFEKKEEDIMKNKPHGHDMPLLTREMKFLIFIIGIITDVLLLSLFFWLITFSSYQDSHIRSIIFAALTIDSIFYIFSCKSLRHNIWKINLFSNKFLIFSWLFGLIALLAALYFPPLQVLLKTEPLNFFDWQLILGLGFLNIALIEFTKWYFISRHQTEL